MSSRRIRSRMDARLWSRLPEDIIERVVAFLPVADLLRYRCVSKPWNSFLSARRPEEIPDSSRQLYLLCLTAVGSQPPVVHVFNVELCKWNELSLRFLPLEMVDLSVMASSGGLLYLQARVANDTIYLTCNPLTKTWRELPPMYSEENSRVPAVGMLTSMATCRNSGSQREDSYKIIEAGHNGLTDLRTKIFDSSTRSWSMGGNIPSDATGFESEGVVINQCLYAVTCLPSKLLKMEVDGSGGAWSEFSAGLPRFAVHPHPVESLGSLAMVAGFDPCWNEGEIPEPTALKIWKLDESAMRWEEISTLPEGMCEKYLSKDCSNFDSLKCTAHGSSIYVANYDGSVVLVYELLEDSWNSLPQSPYLSNGQSCVEQLFVFNPSLQFAV